MPKCSGEGLFLGARSVGETGDIATVFGLETGILRGLCRKTSAIAGDTVRFEHSRRLENQLGRLTCEVSVSRAAFVLSDTAASLVMAYMSEILPVLLPEEHPYPALYADVTALLQESAPWWQRLAVFERALLGAVGYGLSLADDAVPCAVGAPLVYVSPSSGRAVSRVVGLPYHERLLPLPALWGGVPCDAATDCRQTLTLTGSFLERALHGKILASRLRAVHHVQMLATEEAAHVVLDSDNVFGEQRRHG